MLFMENQLSVADLAVVHYHTYPGRPTLVFLHDSLGCITLWRDFPVKLAELSQCNLLVYDRQGYGQSPGFSYAQRTTAYMEWEADILIQLLEYYRVEQPLLFGHSDGASIALIAAGKYPNRIKAVISEAAHIFVEDITLFGINEAAQAYQTTNLKEKLAKYHGNKTEAMFRAWVDTWRAPFFRNWNIERFLPQIACPVLAIQGEADEYGSLAQVEGIKQGIKGVVEVEILPGLKHTPHKENPEAVLETSLRFIQHHF